MDPGESSSQSVHQMDREQVFKYKIEPTRHYCHHCRRQKKGIVVECTARSEYCSLKYCGGCLNKHYGENAMQASAALRWKCPRCRNNCQCSFCRKKRGEKPVGYIKKQDSMIPQSSQPVDHPSSGGSILETNNISEASALTSTTSPQQTSVKAEVPLPQGSQIEYVGSIAMPPSDVGYAFQFLQFCECFGKVFEWNQGDAQRLLESVFYYERQKDTQPLVIQFQEKLISFLRKGDQRETSSTWLEELQRCIFNSKVSILALQLKKSDMTEDEYDQLEPSSKLRVLNFLCDEFLSSDEVRTMVKDHTMLKLEEEYIPNITHEVADKTVGMAIDKEVTPAEDLPGTEGDSAVIIKEDSKENVIRLKPSCITDTGNKFWNFGSSSHPRFLLQDFGEQNHAVESINDRWIEFDSEHPELVEDYISILKSKTRRRYARRYKRQKNN